MRISRPSFSRLALSCLAGVSVAALSSGAFAQTAPAAPAAADDEVEVVIVTATKRETTLQSIPVAVSVTSADTINKAKVRDLNDLQTLVPSLRVSTNQSSANTTFIIRGFGNGANNIGIEPSVAVFIDGVYRSRAGAAIGDLPNIQRVEVLRGPQSTLFGKNASAGVISLITRAPKFEFGGSGEISYGNFNAIVAKGDITGPIGEKAAFAIAGGINKRDGFVEDITLGETLNGRDRWFVRGDLLIQPSDNIKVRVIADHDNIDEICCAVANILDGPTGNAIRGAGGRIPSNAPFGDVSFTNQRPENRITNDGISIQADVDFGKLALTSISAYRVYEAYNGQDVDFTSADVASTTDDRIVKTTTQELRLTSNYDGPLNFLLGAFLFKEDIVNNQQLFYGKNFRTYANFLTAAPTLPGGSLLGLVEALTGNPIGTTFQAAGLANQERYTIENSATSIFGTIDFKINEKFTLTGGFNYTSDSKTAATSVEMFDKFSAVDLVAVGRGLLINQAIATTVGQALRLPGQATAAQIGAFAAAQPAVFAQIQAGATAFGNANATTSTNPLLLVSGLQFQPPFLNFPNSVESGRSDDSATTYSVRLAWEVNDNFNAYASYATGFKATSWNLSRDSRPFAADFIAGSSVTNPPASRIRSAGLALTNLVSGTRFAGPEEAVVMEVGIKARWPKGAFNVTIFDQAIDGFQTNAFTGTGFALVNAGKQSAQGIEFDGTYRPIRPLTLSLAMTYLDPIYDSFVGSPNGDLSGVKPAGIAELTVNAGASYTLALGGGNSLTFRGDLYHQSETQILDGLAGSRAAAIPYTAQFDIFNGGIVFNMANGVELSAWGRNLTDERFLTTIFPSVAQAGSVSGYASQPRTYGVAAKYVF